MKTKISILIFLIAFSVQATEIKFIPTNENGAFTITGLPPQKTWSWKCKWIIFCLPVKTLGATITTINATDQISASRAVINTNFSNLNTDKIEVSTTSIGNITGLPNLATVGTISSGIWQGTKIEVAYGGTGTTTLPVYYVALGNGSYGLTVASSTGISGQFLTSNGSSAYPTWTTAAIDQTLTYSWTGVHNFFSTTTFHGRGTTTFEGAVGIGTSTPSLFKGGLSVGSSTYIAGGLGVGKATTTSGNLEVNGDALFSAAIRAFFYGKGTIATSTTSGSLNTTDGAVTTVTATCPNGMWPISGGAVTDADSGGKYAITSSYPSASTTWAVSWQCIGGGTSCSARNARVHVYCIQP